MSGSILAVIPARLASTRLPEKPLRDVAGKSLLQRVYEQAIQARRVDRVVIATDSEVIRSEGERFGAQVVMSSEFIRSGSERVAVVSRELEGGRWDAVVNVQGDMPFIRPEFIDLSIELLTSRDFDMTTLATPITDAESFQSPHHVKVVVGSADQALYFSRSPIPFSRDGALMKYRAVGGREYEVFGLKHFGLYAFRPAVLAEFEAGETQLEEVEKLEQLRLLDRGFRIGVSIVDPELTRESVEVDTPEDLARAVAIASAKK